jgi:hypothetical protein
MTKQARISDMLTLLAYIAIGVCNSIPDMVHTGIKVDTQYIEARIQAYVTRVYR